MRFLANENFPKAAVEALRARGHDVVWIRESQPGSTDEQVLRKGIEDSRILLTFDKDFGELAFRAKLPAHCGIVLFRSRKRSAALIAAGATALLESRSDWVGHFAVVEEDRLRMTPLAPSEPTLGKIVPPGN